MKNLNRNISRGTPIAIFTFLCFIISLGCTSKLEDKTFKIIHLSPDELITRDTPIINGGYALQRQDFFAVKNFDLKNENHKIAIDSFVVNRIKKDSFLYTHKKVSWALTFFKYGDGIDENTVHEYNTDYTIHTLFAQNKEICNYYFNNKIGYSASNYWESYEPKSLNKDKRKIVVDYFKDSTHTNFIKMDSLVK